MLFKEGSATEQERDRARADFERAAAAVEQVQAQVEAAQINLDETRLTAPMDGVVSARLAEPGALLAAGARVVTITQVDLSFRKVPSLSSASTTIQSPSPTLALVP